MTLEDLILFQTYGIRGYADCPPEPGNKPQAKISTPYEEHIVYRDSIVTKEVPVEVVKEVKTHYGYEKWLWGYVVVSLLVIALYILLKKKRFFLVS